MGVNPETFFPRCWDVNNGDISSLLQGFAVSAAVALLRRFVQGEVRVASLGWKRKGGTSYGREAGTGAALSVVDILLL